MGDWAHSRRLGTPADEAGYVVLRQPPASKLANLFKIDISEVEWPGAALRSWQAGAVQFTARICGLVGRATMADPPSAGGAFLALCRLVAEKPTGWQNGVTWPKKWGKMATFAGTCYVTIYDATPLLQCGCVNCRQKERRETNSHNHLFIKNLRRKHGKYSVNPYLIEHNLININQLWRRSI